MCEVLLNNKVQMLAVHLVSTAVTIVGEVIGYYFKMGGHTRVNFNNFGMCHFISRIQ